MALNQHDQEIYDAILGSTVLSDNTLNMLRKYPDEIGYFAVKVLELRQALREKAGIEDYRIGSLIGMVKGVADIDLGVDELMKVNGYPTDFAAAYRLLLSNQPDDSLDEDFVYSANALYNKDRLSQIVYAPKRRVTNGSIENCFRSCSSMMGLSDEIDFSTATSLRTCFMATSLLPIEYTIDMSSCTDISGMMGNFKILKLKNCNKLTTMQTAFYSNNIIEKVYGLNMSKTALSTNSAFNNCLNIQCIVFDGATYNEDGTITWDKSTENFYRVRGQVFWFNNNNTRINIQTLLALCDMAYDYTNNPHNFTRPSDSELISPFSDSQRSKLIEVYGEDRTKKVMEDKGWTWI